MSDKKNTIDELKKIRDEIRVKTHLGEMELKEWWAGIEPKLAELEDTIAKGADRASESADVFIDELAQAFRRVRDRLGDQK